MHQMISPAHFLTISHKRHSLELELHHLIREALALLTNDVGPGNDDIVEKYLSRVRTVAAYLLQVKHGAWRLLWRN